MGTRHRGTIEEINALNAFIKLQRAAETVSVRIHGVLPEGLTVTQFGVLEALHHIGPLCQSELAEKLGKPSAVSASDLNCNNAAATSRCTPRGESNSCVIL